MWSKNQFTFKKGGSTIHSSSPFLSASSSLVYSKGGSFYNNHFCAIYLVGSIDFECSFFIINYSFWYSSLFKCSVVISEYISHDPVSA